MSFSVGGFNRPSKLNFSSDFSKNLKDAGDLQNIPSWEFDVNPFKFTPKDYNLRSRIRFYDNDSLWARWRRGYELYSITQSVYGSTVYNRSTVGDYRVYCAFQQYPGIFIPARVFSFPSSSTEIGEQLVAMRDANALNFYDFGLPILSIRYLGDAETVSYSQSGTTITVSYPQHGFQLNDNVYLNFLSGSAVTATLTIVSKTANSFTCTAAAPLTTIGNVSVALSTVFTDLRWTEIRAKLRYLPSPANSIIGERFTDRISEEDPGVAATYTRIGTTVTVTCSTSHGLFTGNKVNLSVSSGNVSPGLYTITVTSPTVFTVTTIDSGAASGSAIVYRLIEKYNYDNYVGYTVKEVDFTTNEIIFQRGDSYGATTTNNKTKLAVPAHRGFFVGRFLTSELRYQCSCQDFTRRSSYNFYDENHGRRFPKTAITSTKPGTILNKDDSITDTRESIGVFSDMGYIATNNFYELPDYNDKKQTCYTELMYYQMRWCKHIYAALFSLAHDEGNESINLSGNYTQANSFDIVVNASNHGLQVNTKVDVNFTSGAALSGQYLIGQVLDANSFVIVYPYSQTTSGYCEISNIADHSYVRQWLLEPSDHPVGDSSDTFYKNFTKENSRVRQAAERAAMLKMGKAWSGTTTTLDFQNQPKTIANFQPTLLTSLLTDNISRDLDGALDPEGELQNTTQRLISIVSKVVNLEPTLISSTKFGFLAQPLSNYTTDYQYGLILGGTYLNGAPTESPTSVSIIDCSTYSPITSQDVLIDCGTYSL